MHVGHIPLNLQTASQHLFIERVKRQVLLTHGRHNKTLGHNYMMHVCLVTTQSVTAVYIQTQLTLQL